MRNAEQNKYSRAIIKRTHVSQDHVRDDLVRRAFDLLDALAHGDGNFWLVAQVRAYERPPGTHGERGAAVFGGRQLEQARLELGHRPTPKAPVVSASKT